ncbi:hypothetical protein F4808DRAFT_475739 [Astrocystis sublimbata]|nr:hypothetical protein F4808DRAFT_475739 [Astrocystis sublimbata]
MKPHVYTLRDVLAVAKIHPFYNKHKEYPPVDSDAQAAIQRAAEAMTDAALQRFPLLWKENLYTSIERLVDDTSPKNTYRHSIYASITGGGGTGGAGSRPLFFATDAVENRRQRATFGRLLREIGVVSPGEWVLTVHSAGELYRSLDLVLEVLENAGASVLSAGNWMSAADVSTLLTKYHVNVLTGDSSQITEIVHHISSLPFEKRELIKLDKIIYTSEVLTPAQRGYIARVLGQVKICSMFASAESGPWAASHADLTQAGTPEGSVDFIFDTRTSLVEIFPPNCTERDAICDPLPDGERGVVVQTSLTRLKHPLVRYVTGDIGSLHDLPDTVHDQLSGTDRHYLRVLRLTGRDRRFSFSWDGEYIDFAALTSLMSAEPAVLQWQVILGKIAFSFFSVSSLEVRVFCATRGQDAMPTQHAIADRITSFLHVYDMNAHRFSLKFVESMDGFERSGTGRKVMKFIDRYSELEPCSPVGS